MTKKFKLSEDEIETLIDGYGSCIATDKITVEGFPVRFMYREKPDSEDDSGWRFMSGFESEEYMDDSNNYSLYDVNTIANYDQSIIPLLDSKIGSVFEKESGNEKFNSVTDWEFPSD